LVEEEIMKKGRFIITGLMIVASLLSGCSSGSTSSTPVVEEQSGSTRQQAIPDGTYERALTRAEFQNLGITPKEGAKEGLYRGRTSMLLRVQGSDWTQFQVNDGGVPDLGDLGTLTYEPDGTVTLASDSEGCSTCVYAYSWTLDGDQLTTRMVEHQSPDTPAELRIVRLVTEGTWARQ
jgi:hypothetical protein